MALNTRPTLPLSPYRNSVIQKRQLSKTTKNFSFQLSRPPPPNKRPNNMKRSNCTTCTRHHATYGSMCNTAHRHTSRSYRACKHYIEGVSPYEHHTTEQELIRRLKQLKQVERMLRYRDSQIMRYRVKSEEVELWKQRALQMRDKYYGRCSIKTA